MRYQSLSSEEKQRRIKQIRDSLQRKLDSCNVSQLAEYKEKKKCQNHEHYLNQKVMKALGDLCVSKAVKRRATVFGQVQARIIIPPHVSKLYHLVGNSPIPGGSFGCYVSQFVHCIAVTCVCLSVYAVAHKMLDMFVHEQGEITAGSVHRICNELLQLGLIQPKRSVVLDCGSGLGLPCLHLALYLQTLCLGIELDYNLFLCSVMNLKKVSAARLNECRPCMPVSFVNGDILQIKSLEGVNLLYGFDCLFPPSLLEHMATLFNASESTRVLVSFCNERTLHTAGYMQLKLRAKLSVRMRGSGEAKTAFIYVKDSRSHFDRNLVDALFKETIEAYHDGNLHSREFSVDLNNLYLPRSLRKRKQG